MPSPTKSPALSKTKLTTRQQELLACVSVTDNRAVTAADVCAAMGERYS